MCTIKRLIVLICTTALCVCLFANAKAKADTLPYAPEVLKLYVTGDLTGIANAYIELTQDQKLIANYIIGAWNNIYLCARGFSYTIPDTEDAFKAQFLALGEEVWNYVTTAYGWRSRMNEVFRQYLSSACVYASGISTTFDVWYVGIKQGGNNQLYIPYSEESFDAWTEFYNDPSGDGIASFGMYTSEWNSGQWYDFGFIDVAWYNSQTETTYNNFILDKSPVLFSNAVNNIQCIVSGQITLPNVLYVLRPQNGQYSSFRFGVATNGILSTWTMTGNILRSNTLWLYLYQGKIIANYNYTNFVPRTNAFTVSNPVNTLGEIINFAFTLSPFQTGNNASENSYSIWDHAYALINNVYLVDDLNSLSNPEEVFNNESLNIEAPVNDNYIIAPNGRLILPLWPYADDDPMGFWDIIQDNSYDIETELPATDDDYHTSIVNNTTINNYYVSDDTKINVPANWFDNEHTDLLFQDSVPFLNFVHDTIASLGDLQLYIYGAIVIGLAGGIVKKLLL